MQETKADLIKEVLEQSRSIDKNFMKSKSYHLVTTAIIFILATSCEQFESVDQFRSLKVGVDYLPVPFFYSKGSR